VSVEKSLPIQYKKTVVLISSGQPSLNPRLVKEADALTDAGYGVTVIYAYWNTWGSNFDKPLLLQKKWKAVLAGGSPAEKPLIYLSSRIIHKSAKWLFNKFHFRFLTNMAISRSAYFLISAAKKHKADLYIGHNLGALGAVIKTSAKYNAKSGFDAEDFHRQEVSDDTNSFPFKICKHLEDKYLPRVSYITAASPLIAEQYAELYNCKVTSILNVFPKKQVTVFSNKNDPLKLFWFSQTIGSGRGLAEVIGALQHLKQYEFELHLLGDADDNLKDYFINQLNNTPGSIHFYRPIPANEIIAFAAQFDIGLAPENKIPFNRDICLTNKIFTYIQSGLAIIASDTRAQTALLNQYAGIGKLYEAGNTKSLADTLLYYHQKRDELFEIRKTALSLAQAELNWEQESQKFLHVIKETLNEREF